MLALYETVLCETFDEMSVSDSRQKIVENLKSKKLSDSEVIYSIYMELGKMNGILKYLDICDEDKNIFIKDQSEKIYDEYMKDKKV